MTFMELLLTAKLGSTLAFEELFARYKNLLRKYLIFTNFSEKVEVGFQPILGRSATPKSIFSASR